MPKSDRHYFQFVSSFVLILTVLVSFLFQVTPLLSEEKTNLAPVDKGNPSQAKVAFACNVFWGEEFLPQMLEIMAQNNIKTTFFIGGSWAKKNPELVNSMARAGHELGNHTYSHPHPNNLDKAQNKEQILRTESLVKEITGIKTNLYAPPYIVWV